MDALAGGAVRLMAAPRWWRSSRRTAKSALLVAVGPEGGWTDFERQLFARLRFHLVGLGPRTLRSDTFCVALLAVANDAIARHQPSIGIGQQGGPNRS